MSATAVLRIASPDLDPDAVTRALGVRPTSAHGRGDAQRFATGLLHGEGSWTLKSGLPEVLELSAHLDELVGRLEAATDAVARFRRAGASVELECTVSAHEGERVTLSEAMIARLHALRVTVVLHIAGD